MPSASPPSGLPEATAAPSNPGVPDPPNQEDVFSKTQWAVLVAILDAIIPSIAPKSAVSDNKLQHGIQDSEYNDIVQWRETCMVQPPDTTLFKAYLEDRPSCHPAFMHSCTRALQNVPEVARTQLGHVLYLLSNKLGAFVLTGHMKSFLDQPVHVRESILQSWAASRFAAFRTVVKAFALLAQGNYLQTNPLYAQVSGYPDVPVGWRPGPAYDFSFLQFAASPEPAELETDIVIVGSGCGGAVCAKVLAEAGHRVLVVDKGHHFPPTQLPMPQAQAPFHLYENGGMITASDASVAAVAGSCWGGGGTVNWSVALQTQGFVRREWAEDCGLPLFATQEFQESLDRVSAFMGVGHEAIRHNHRARMLLEGARRLGWDARPAPQNTGGKEHWCGHCHLGCGSSEKRGPTVSWLPAAAKAGAQFVEGLVVDHITFDESDGERKATGVVGRWTSRDNKGGLVGPLDQRVTRRVAIKAKKVIISAGAFGSPLVLLKSGLDNRHIGRNLHLHPVNFVGGVYEEDVRPWEGGIITSVCTSFENLDGHGHGVKLESTCMVPYAFLAVKPWRSGLDFKLTAMRLRHMSGFIALTRDRDTGRVYPDPSTGKVRLEYTPSAFDAAHTLEGLLALARMCYVTGATEIHAFLPGVAPFIRSKEKETAFETWLDGVRAAGNAPPQTPFISAHQMGTCRMSSHAGDGVVDARGRVWGTEGLYVADASVFPSASGVNPMVTIMAIADGIARGIVKELDEAK